MSIALKQYSSGYRSISGQVSPGVDLSMFRIENCRAGDPELVELLKTVQLFRLDNVSSDHKLQIIDCAKRLFGDFDKFVQYNVLSNNLVRNVTLNLTGPNYIAKWIRQPNGFADLVSTLILMFGIPLKDITKHKNGLI